MVRGKEPTMNLRLREGVLISRLLRREFTTLRTTSLKSLKCDTFKHLPITDETKYPSVVLLRLQNRNKIVQTQKS